MRAASPSAAERSVEELCDKFHNESVHTEHVVVLALRLFDESRQRFSLPLRDRTILKVAAQLHDVAYSVNPRRHRELGAEIMLGKGLDGFSEADRADVAAIMLCHSGNLAKLPAFDSHVRCLGAMLRVADGMDFGHVQDTEIVRVQQLKSRVRVFVRAPHFPRNVERAHQKADLWREVFPVGIEIVLLPDKKGA